MFRILTSVLLAVSFAVMPQIANGQDINGSLYGDGVSLLVFDDAFEASGLEWVIHEPERANHHWAISARNTSEVAVSNVTATIDYMVDGQWYLSGLDQSEMFLLPGTIGPGDIGFAVGDWMGHAPVDWTDVRLVVDSVGQGESSMISSLAIHDLQRLGDGGYSGTLVNDSEYSLTDVGVNFACVDPAGRIIDDFYNGIDLRTMDPGDEESFTFTDANGECESDTEVIAASAGRNRD